MLVALFLIAYIVLLVLVVLRPPIALGPIVCMFGAEQFLFANVSFFRSNAAIVNYAVGVLVLAGLLSNTMRGGKIAFYWPPIGWLILLLHGYYAVSFFWSISPEWTISNLTFMAPYTLTISFSLPLLFRDLKDVRLGLMVTVFMALILSVLLLGTTQIHKFGRTIEFAGEISGSRFSDFGGRGNPLAIADLGAALSLIAVLLRWPKGNKLWQWLKWLAVFTGSALVLRSGSRGQFVGMIVAVAAFYKFSRPKTNVQILVTGLISAVAFGLIIAFAMNQFAVDQGSRFDVSTFGEAYSNTRVELCSTLLKEWIASSPLNWVFGLGAAASWGIQGIYPHVVPVEVLCELGVLGFAGYIILIGFASTSLYRLGKMTKNSGIDRSTVAVMAALFVFNFLMSLKQGSFLFFYHMFFVAIMTARTEWQLKRKQRSKKIEKLKLATVPYQLPTMSHQR